MIDEFSEHNYHKSVPKKESVLRKRVGVRFLGNQLLLILALAVSLTTTLGILYLIVRLELTKDIEVIKLSKIEDGSEELSINEDLSVDTLIPQNELRFGRISSDSIKIVSAANQKHQRTGIQVGSNSISMQAQTFSSGLNSPGYLFTVERRLNVLEIPESIENIRAIRAPSSKKSRNPTESKEREVNLEILSDGNLELSGNRGLRVHSRDLSIDSSSSISIESKEGPVRIMSKTGLLLPAVQYKNNHDILKRKLNRTERLSESSILEVPDEYQLCISRDDGSIFQTLGACSSHLT